MRNNFDQFNKALQKNVIFWRDCKIHARKRGLPTNTKFKEREIKKLLDEIAKNGSNVSASTNGLQAICARDSRYQQKNGGALCPHAMKPTKKGKIDHMMLCQASNAIKKPTSYVDPIDSLTVYAYIGKVQTNKVIVKEKKKWECDVAQSSKSVIHSFSKKIEEQENIIPHSLEMTMEDTQIVKK